MSKEYPNITSTDAPIPGVVNHDDEAHDMLDIDINNDSKNGVLIHNGKKYAVNLIWLSNSEDEFTDSIIKKAKAIGSDFYCSRSLVIQTGYGYLNKGHRIGMVSAASAAADTLIGEWHGVFKAENGWLYVAVHSDMIAPDGDCFFKTEDEAYNYFYTEDRKYNWPKKYVPDHWEIANNDGEIDLSKIMETFDRAILKPANLQSVFGGRSNMLVALFAFTGLLALFLLYSLGDMLGSTFVPEPLQPNVTISNDVGSLVVPPKEREIGQDPLSALLDNERMTNPVKLLQGCINNFDDLMVSIPGWNINQMRCRGNFVEGVWQRSVGTVETLRNNLKDFPSGTSKTYGSNGNFIASRIITNISELSEPLQLVSRESAIILLNKKLGDLGALQVTDVQQSRPTSRNNVANTSLNNTNDRVALLTIDDLPSLAVTFRTEISPLEIKENFSIPGLKLNIMEWSLQNGEWSFGMTLYLYPEDYQGQLQN